MANKLQIYLDTSVVCHLFHDDAPQRRDETRLFFDNGIARRLYAAYISDAVLDEIRKTPDPVRRAELMDVLRDYGLTRLPPTTPEIARLAKLYQDRKIVPARNRMDAMHLAFFTVFRMDALVTWNFRHLARSQTEALVNGTNLMEGYHGTLRLITPLELANP